jgi:hypothetical protein
VKKTKTPRRGTRVADPNKEIKRQDLTLTETGWEYADDAAVQIVMRDMDTWNGYIVTTDWAAQLTQADTLLQSPQNLSPWGQGSGPAQIVPNFLLSNALDTIVPKIVFGLTYEDPMFLLRPRPGTTQDTVRQKTAVFSYQLEDMNITETIEDLVFDDALKGTCIAKWGWHTEKRKFRKFKLKGQPLTTTTPTGFTASLETEDSDAIEFELVETETRRPFLEAKSLTRVGWDPGWKKNDIRGAKWVVEWDYLDWEGLEKLAQNPEYTIPPRETLLDWFFRDKKAPRQPNQVETVPEGMRAQLVHAIPQAYNTSADPLRAVLCFIERTDGNAIMSVLCHGSDCILVRNTANPYTQIAKECGGSGHNYLSSVWRKLPDSSLGQGLGQILGPRQMVAQGTENLALQVLAYGMNPTFLRTAGWNDATQEISLTSGDVLTIEGDDVRKGFGILEMPKVPTESWEVLKYNKAEGLESAGVSQQFGMGAGAAGVQTLGARSATGASQVGAAGASRLDGPIERFIRQIFEPFLYIVDNLNNILLPTKDLRKILADEGEDMTDFNHLTFREAQMKYEVLAGAHLGPKKEMAQFLLAVEQIAINPALLEAAAQADMKFNFAEWFKSFAEISGFKFSQQFFVKMTDAEKKRRDQNSKAALLAQQHQQKQGDMQQQHQNKTSEIYDQALARAGEKATVLETEHALLDGVQSPTSGLVG